MTDTPGSIASGRMKTWMDDAADVIEAQAAEIERMREHADELVGLLREALEELDDYYRAEYDTDHPYHQDKLDAARDAWSHARDILARIEGEVSK